MVKVGILLVAAESFAALSLCLLLLVIVSGLGAGPLALGLVLGDALALGLLVCGGCGGGLGLGLCGLLLLLAFYLRVLGIVPVLEDLFAVCFDQPCWFRKRCRPVSGLTSEPSSSSSNLRRAGAVAVTGTSEPEASPSSSSMREMISITSLAQTNRSAISGVGIRAGQPYPSSWKA